MASYLERLAARTIEPARLLQPRVPARFATEAFRETSLETQPAMLPAPQTNIAAPAGDAPARPPVTRVVEVMREVPLQETPALFDGERRVEPAMTVERPLMEQPAPLLEHETAEPLPPLRAAGPAAPSVVVRRVEQVEGIERVERVERVQGIERIERHRQERELETIRVASSERDIHVTIGRIEVRAVTPAPVIPPAPRPRREPPKTQSLEEYLAQRDRERR